MKSYHTKDVDIMGRWQVWTRTERNGWRSLFAASLRTIGDWRAIARVEVALHHPRGASVGAGIEFGPGEDGDKTHAHFGVGIVDVHVLSSAGPFARLSRWLVGRGRREVSFVAYLEPADVASCVVQWHLWTDPDDGSARAHDTWRRGVAYPLDMILGRCTYHRQNGTADAVTVPMPEGTYPATVHRETATWTRPRWPGAWLRTERMVVTIPGGIPIPGRGENPHDLDDDALDEHVSRTATNIRDAVIDTVAEGLRLRADRAGIAWRPTAPPAPVPVHATGAS